MSSASEKVAGTAELLEQIVFHLPPHEILLSQRVSRQWKANIATSRRLQRLLFFEPVTDLKMTTKRFGRSSPDQVHSFQTDVLQATVM